jgi:hypothetical protein
VYFIAHRVLNLLFVEVVVYWVVVCLLRYGLLVLGGLSLSRLSVVVVVCVVALICQQCIHYAQCAIICSCCCGMTKQERARAIQ